MKYLSSIVLATAFFANMECPGVGIDHGRQLFIDDYVIEASTLKRTWHYPVKYEGNPVMKPETPLEINKGGNAATVPKGGGIWWDDKEKVFKLWYESGWLHAVTYATSKDGLKWERPKLDVVPGTNAVLPLDDPSLRPDSWSVVKDPNPRNPDELYKMFLRRPNCVGWGVHDGWTLVSGDGIHWKKVAPVPACGDRSSLYYNRFRDTWVFSLRSFWKNKGETYARRNRCYYEQSDFMEVPSWYTRAGEIIGAERWLQADELDLPDPTIENQPRTQLYNFDAVAYESIMLGIAEIHLGPENNVCGKVGLPKITDLKFAYSRDGKNFIRPDRTPAISSERWGHGKWDAGYVQSVANLCVVMGDELWFYYGAFAGAPERGDRDGKKFDWTRDNGMYANGAMGIAKMRRDGFASMDGTGELLTKSLGFSGEYLFVNVDASEGSFAVELLDSRKKVVDGFGAADSVVEKIDSTKYRVRWKTKDRLNVAKMSSHRLRFRLKNASLYSFWVSMDETGASNGYLAGGGPGYPGLIDKPKRRGIVQPKIFTPNAEYAKSTRKHEGIASMAVSNGGRMWATWYGGEADGENECNYLVLSSSTDDGRTWKEFLICDPDADGPRRAFDPEVWISPDGSLRWFWTDRVGTVGTLVNDDQLWMATLDAETGRMIGTPRVIAKGVMMCKPIVLKDGTWMLPVSHWWAAPSACVYASTDSGRTFHLRGGATHPVKLRGFDEHNIVECKDGSIVSYMRVFNGDGNCLMQSRSRDGGYTWSKPVFCPAINLNSRSFVRKLKSGNWLMVKHGRYGELLGSRTHLTALISKDEGRTWEGGLVLDMRRNVSYPDGQQLADGSIVVVNDFERTGAREVSFVRFREEDVLKGISIPGTCPKRMIISRAVPVHRSSL